MPQVLGMLPEPEEILLSCVFSINIAPKAKGESWLLVIVLVFQNFSQFKTCDPATY
jgi:hypothetical protein